MSAPFRVLVTMQGIERVLRHSQKYMAADSLADVHSAVAELIEADKAFDAERKGLNPLYADRERLDRYEAAENRRAAALARVQGVSA